MRAQRLVRVHALTVALVIGLVLILILIGVVVERSLGARSDAPCPRCESGFTFAVFGDYPYTAQQRANLPKLAAQMNADPDVSLVAHLGDIKSDVTKCTTKYYREIKTDFNLFDDPFVYTPGDNEWSDCDEPSNGGYNPLERLSALRKVFFQPSGRTLGQTKRAVTSMASSGYPENVMFTSARVQFGAFHAVGPRNGLVTWSGQTQPTPAERAEFNNRTAAAVALITASFKAARESDARAVVLFTQADMFSPQRPDSDALPYQPIVKALATESSSFHKPVYLFDGDTHQYAADTPLAANAKWPRLYKVSPAENLTRVTVDGDENATDYLRVTIRGDFSKVLSWDRVAFIQR